MKKIIVRQSSPEDAPAVLALYPVLFPEEDLTPLVRALLEEKESVLSLVALSVEKIAGHAMFSSCGVKGSNYQAALLGPLGVLPTLQKQGIGSALVQTGMEMLAARNIHRICVLGDPGYYGRFGFRPERNISPPYPIPEGWSNAWQSFSRSDKDREAQGKLIPPAPWLDPALWK